MHKTWIKIFIRYVIPQEALYPKAEITSSLS